MKNITEFILEAKRQDNIEYIYQDGEVVWISTQVSDLGDMSYSGFLQDANCCFKVSVADTDIEEGKVILLTSHAFDSEDDASAFAADYGKTQKLTENEDWEWDSDGFLICIYDGNALYVGATALNGGKKATADSITNVLKNMKAVN